MKAVTFVLSDANYAHVDAGKSEARHAMHAMLLSFFFLICLPQESTDTLHHLPGAEASPQEEEVSAPARPE